MYLNALNRYIASWMCKPSWHPQSPNKQKALIATQRASNSGMASLMFGLVFILPWLGHASWHAYRDLVDTSGLPAME